VPATMSAVLYVVIVARIEESEFSTVASVRLILNKEILNEIPI